MRSEPIFNMKNLKSPSSIFNRAFKAYSKYKSAEKAKKEAQFNYEY